MRQGRNTYLEMSPQSGLRVQRSAWECCTLKNNTRVVLFDSCSLAGVATLCHDRSVIVSLLCSVAACARVIILSVNTWIVHTSVIHTLLLTLALLTQFLCVGFSLTIFSHSSANNPLVSLTSDRPLTLSTFQPCVCSPSFWQSCCWVVFSLGGTDRWLTR